MDPQTERNDGERSQVVHNVVRHLIHCNTCRTSLGKAEGHEDAITFLHAQRNDANTPAVERVLRSTAAAGKLVLADLVYELAKAALLEDDRFSKCITARVEPRELPVVAQHLEGVAHHLSVLSDFDLPPACQRAVSITQTTASPLELGTSLLSLLNSIEGRSPRYFLVHGYSSLRNDNDEDALEAFTTVVNELEASEADRLLGVEGMARVAMRGGDFDAAREVLAHGLALSPANKTVRLMSILGDALGGSSDQALRDLEAFGTLKAAASEYDEQRAHHLVPLIAESLGVPVGRVRSLVQ